jgi:Uma2 family endonuclease
MATATLSRPTYETFADVLKQLGDIPAERIWLLPLPGTATEQDVIDIEAHSNRLCELVDGVLVEKPMGYYESRVAVVLIGFLEIYLRKHDLGIVLGGDGMLRVAPGQVRMPDVSFFFWRRFPGRILPPGAILNMVPDFAVEVLSRTNTKKEMERKRRENFAGGAQLVWEVDPVKHSVRVYTSPNRSTVHGEDETLDGGEVLPGFSVSIRKWFERAGKRA